MAVKVTAADRRITKIASGTTGQTLLSVRVGGQDTMRRLPTMLDCLTAPGMLRLQPVIETARGEAGKLHPVDQGLQAIQGSGTHHGDTRGQLIPKSSRR